jgi:hypothetical protein
LKLIQTILTDKDITQIGIQNQAENLLLNSQGLEIIILELEEAMGDRMDHEIEVVEKGFRMAEEE